MPAADSGSPSMINQRTLAYLSTLPLLLCTPASAPGLPSMMIRCILAYLPAPAAYLPAPAALCTSAAYLPLLLTYLPLLFSARLLQDPVYLKLARRFLKTLEVANRATCGYSQITNVQTGVHLDRCLHPSHLSEPSFQNQTPRTSFPSRTGQFLPISFATGQHPLPELVGLSCSHNRQGTHVRAARHGCR